MPRRAGSGRHERQEDYGDTFFSGGGFQLPSMMDSLGQ
jgi:hypothetical protein